MLDNALIALIISTLQTGMATVGQSSVAIKQSFQPTQQSANSVPTVYLAKIADRMIGYPYVTSVANQPLSANFTGSISGQTLNVSAVTSGTIAVGQFLYGAGIPSGIIIAALGSGTGGVGTYTLSSELNVASETMKCLPSNMVHTEITQFETTFQFSALATQNPANTSQLTAADILNYARYVLQSQPSIATLEAQGVGVYNINQVRNPAFMDDRDNFEYSPSFDVTFTHKQIIITATPAVLTEIVQILPV
jgi:hypothetical protein